ncbi:MAG TPA: tetratricopeptide repeat protein [Nitrospira sp.]|nr:tetratricopeptide repeat protein [Nitrospira sp.]HNI18708.1 tetratricopeptide repeat protein [Nitrospira sp.]HNK76447.1 tetratricopeptide repeat protein [Nitrospira sp.]HNM18916.1 tetratricopeptide repeat protein [Nitrospira sp.]HNM61285.1 tetratricopeptide repeat protein [Nitrospira sp.]
MNREERRREEKLQGRNAGGPAAALAGLREAQMHHQAGRLDDAERGYQQLLARMPAQPDALHGLGLLLYRRGNLRDALTRLAQARAADARNPVYCFNHGVVLQRAGLLPDAVDAYNRAIQLNPRYIDPRTNLGNAYKELGRLAEAQATYEQVLALNPDHAEAHNNLGVVLKEQGRLDAAADAYRKAIALKPAHAEAHNNLGLVLLEQGLVDDAIRSFERALQAHPGYGTALYNLGIAWIWREDIPRALHCFAETAKAKCAHGRPVTDSAVFRSRVKHDAEQIGYLFERGLIGEEWRGYHDALLQLCGRLEPAPGTVSANRVALSPADLQPIAPSFNRLLYIAPCDTIAEGALAPDLDHAAIEARYLATQPEVTYIDGLLSEEALRRLREFCWTSTIWKKDYENGYIGAFLGDGFASPLLLQIAEELRRRLPRIFGTHRLTQAWAFKHDSARRGLNIHADAAAVNVNFWITPDDANLNPESGGLVVWDKEAPREWDFKTYNSDKARGSIYEWLTSQGAKEIKIPYRANRAVVFNSDLFHETDDIAFKEGLTNRRINITLLYGHRHRP